nr:hypothetical protein [Tanacetum cinerariifolium]
MMVMIANNSFRLSMNSNRVTIRTMMCQPIAQNIDFSGLDQIQTPQYPDIHLSSPEISYEVFQANHSIQNEESFENPSNEIVVSDSIQEKKEPAQEFDIRQLIREECSVKVCEEQKQKPEHLLSMGYEHLSITPEMESDEVTKSNAENLVPILSECEVTLEDKRECDLPISENSPVCDNSDIFFDSKINDDISVYDDDFEDIEYVEASLPDPEIVSEEENEGDIRFLEELLIDDSILSHDSYDFNFEDNPSIPRPPPEPPDVETDAGEEILVVMNDKDKFDKDYHFFMFDKVFSLLFAESEDTIFDPSISD